MKTINLLPKEEKIRDVKGVILNAALVLFTIILIALVIFTIFLFDVSNYLAPKLDEYKMVNMQLYNYIIKLNAYNEFKEKVKTREEKIGSLQKEELLWSEVLNDFGERIPKNAYVNYIEGSSGPFYNFISETGGEDQGNLKKILFFTVGGYAADYTDITKLFVEIRNMSGIGEVWINNISKNYIEESGIEVLSFNISAYLDMSPYLEGLGVGEITETPAEGANGEEDFLEMEMQSLSE
ncbi:MAG: hypothetical protein PHQ09_02795 [Actinomycetota bacterium]|nr:hypothetical protein [Actinomycetota bacterium]